MRCGLAGLLTTIITVLADDLVVLKHGSLKGHRLTSRKGREIFAFQGVPYAKPPVGELRFKPPQPAEPWTGVLDATKEAPVCVQRGLFPSDVEVRGQEDCLYLNVYTPRIPKSGSEAAPLDVMVWVHGGGWFTGSGNTDMYGPQYLLDKDIILVTMNYRLGLIGFLSTEDAECPGNNGMKDQVAALRWVRDNIAEFGGNPNSVTIFGESAGGSSTHFHMLSPASKGLFHRAISQSGTAVCAWALTPPGRPKLLAEQVADMFNCPTQSSSELISCLRKQDSYKLYGAELLIPAERIFPITFAPVIEKQVGEGDEIFMSENPMKILLSGDLELVPWMVGVTSREGGLFPIFLFGPDESKVKLEENSVITMLLENPEDKSLVKKVAQKAQKFYFGDKRITYAPDSGITDMITDLFFLVGTNSAARLHSKRGEQVYYYLFDYRGKNSFSTVGMNSTANYGPVHLDDVLYLFPQDVIFRNSKLTAEDERMVETMTALWTNFARSGEPAPTWKPVSSPEVLDYVRIAHDGLHHGQGLLKERSEFWETLPLRTRYSVAVGKDEL
ncbi:Esterase FE4 [Cryptotermes secundus]|uniref:Carboxylic ester hydrolase n=1 Tax=Cryptotermes secundus TaxID=105785 RepID=A0A2J7RF26_9NEOP|nr:Esterase FE4 [Cryptotermes secundus]